MLCKRLRNFRALEYGITGLWTTAYGKRVMVSTKWEALLLGFHPEISHPKEGE